MNYYKLFSYALRMSPRMRLFGLSIMHILNFRYLNIQIDPVLACNYRCKMCYRSGNENKNNNHHFFKVDDIIRISNAFFPYAMRLQVGCATEPTMKYAESLMLIKEARKQGIKRISLCTNGVLLKEDRLRELASAGLNEIIISCHGIRKETYEYFMGGRYDSFLNLISSLRQVKKEYPQLYVRINYTMNADNTAELTDFWKVFDTDVVDILQLRPVQDLGSTEYTNYDLTDVYNMMDSVIQPLCKQCIAKGIKVLAPEKENLEQLGENKQVELEINKRFQDFCIAYISPDYIYRKDFDIMTDTYRSYAHRSKFTNKMLRSIFMSSKNVDEVKQTITKHANYTIK